MTMGTPIFSSSNDGMRQFLFHNNGDGTFTERALEAGTALTADGKPLSGMGTVFQDYDNDGRPDMLVTVLPREVYAVFHNDGNGSSATADCKPAWDCSRRQVPAGAWASRILTTTAGRICSSRRATCWTTWKRLTTCCTIKEPPLLALNHKGRFERADSGITSAIAGRGAAFGDLNNDGWMDVVVTSLGGAPLVLMNHGGTGHWLSISLRGTRSNRDGLGARVQVNGQTRFATTSGSYISASDKRLHFGLGSR